MPSLVKIDPVVLKKKILNLFKYILANSLLSPLGKGRDLVPSLDEIGSVVMKIQCIIVISSLPNYLGKGHDPSFEQT